MQCNGTHPLNCQLRLVGGDTVAIRGQTGSVSRPASVALVDGGDLVRESKGLVYETLQHPPTRPARSCGALRILLPITSWRSCIFDQLGDALAQNINARTAGCRAPSAPRRTGTHCSLRDRFSTPLFFARLLPPKTQKRVFRSSLRTSGVPLVCAEGRSIEVVGSSFTVL